MSTPSRTLDSGHYNSDLGRLATLSAVGITCAGLLLLLIIGYAGWASNESSTSRERTLLDNALNLSIARTLNEQKGVAWWDDAVSKITDSEIDLEFTDNNFGVFLTETYGHDEIYILNGKDQPLYSFANSARGEPRAFESRRSDLAAIIAEVRGTLQQRHSKVSLKLRSDDFGEDQRNYRTLGGALDTASWAGHMLSVDGKLSVVAAITIVPNIDMGLLKGAPNILISITHIDNDYVATLGRSLLLKDLAIAPYQSDTAGIASQLLEGDDGANGGYLTWTTEQPGSILLHVILPLVALGILLVAVLAGGMLRRLKASSNELATRELQSRHDSRHDALSDLPNRPHFAEKLGELLASLPGAGSGAQVLVAYIDIDHFKDVNDTLGHQAGDDLIKLVSQRLSSRMRVDALLSRYGGDEFAIFWLGTSPSAGEALAQRIQSTFAAPFDVGNQSLSVTASAGITASQGDYSTVEDLMRQADIALYEAKAQGRDRAVFFSEDMARRVEERRTIELELRAALAGGHLRLNYQPIVCCRSGRVVGVEALLRWRHPLRGEISPAIFIPIAEQSGFMPLLGEWVLSRAMKDQKKWPQLQVSINLSPVQFRQAGLEGLLQALVQEHGVDPRNFVLEITEGVLMESCDRTSHTLDAIHTMGFQTALDDFGTGYSSLAYLCNFRFDKIKIDRAFVSGMSKSESYQKIVHAIIALGKGLGMKIVAEGVETDAEARLMTELGCGELQGYYFSRPIEPEQLCKLLESHRPQPATATIEELEPDSARVALG